MDRHPPRAARPMRPRAPQGYHSSVTVSSRSQETATTLMAAWLAAVGAAIGSVAAVRDLGLSHAWRIAIALLAVASILLLLLYLTRHARPLLLASLSAVGICLVLLAVAPEARKKPDLRLLSTNVSGGRYGEVEALEVFLQNTGEATETIVALNVSIIDFVYAPTCYTQGEVTPSGAYDYEFPLNPKPGATFSVPLYQEAQPNESTLFTFKPSAPTLQSNTSLGTEGGTFLYALNINLQTGSKKTLSLGSVVLATPFSPSFHGEYWDRTASDRAESIAFMGDKAQKIATCLDTNTSAIEKLASKGVIKSELLRKLSVGEYPS